MARSFRSQIFNTGPIHEQGRRQDFSLGGGGGLSASEACRRGQSICAASEASPLAGAGARGAQPPENFCEIGCFRRHLALKKFVGQQ